MVSLVSHEQLLEQELRQLREEFIKAEQQGKAFRDPGVRMYLQRRILQLDAELHGLTGLQSGPPLDRPPRKG